MKLLGVVAIVIVVIAGGAYFTITSMDSTNTNDQNTNSEAQLPTDTVGIQDTVVGNGKEAVSGATVTVNYTGALTNGTVFDSSIPRGEPFVFKLGEGKVIPGWEAGLLGMKEGGKRVLVIPPQFAYGSQDYGPIPANSTLIFEVELLKVQ